MKRINKKKQNIQKKLGSERLEPEILKRETQKRYAKLLNPIYTEKNAN